MNLSKKRCTQAGFHVSSGVLALVLVFCVGIVFNPGLFLSHSNMQNILRQTVTNALLAYGMAFVIISGSIDLSVAATVAMSGYITVWLLPYSFALALAAAVLFGVAVGTINGYLIAKVKFPPMIATYSMQLMIKGLILVLTNGITLKISTDSLIMKYLGHGMLFNLLPLGFVFLMAIFGICAFSIRRIPIIRSVYAVGGNEDAARMMGISVFKSRITAHIICSVLACLAGINVAARTGAATAGAGDGYDMLAIASVVIGGISMSGGKGTFSGCMFGAMVVAILSNIFKLQNFLNAYWERAIIGIVLLAVLLIQALMNQEEIRGLIKKYRFREGQDMEKKRAIVSGGGRGIGAGISVKLAEEGYDLAISYANRPDCAEETARQIRERFGRECHVMRAVFEEEGAAECFVHESIDKLGGVDLLVNNAIRPGLGGSILDIDTGEMDMLMRADLRAAILCTREAARYMAKHEVRGNIIMISSMRAERAMPNAGLYSGFKAGINQMTKCFCLDLAPFGIRVNSVEPGAIAVRTREELLESGMPAEVADAKEAFAERIPLGRKGNAKDIAEAVAFLASEKASYITGATLLVDGGLTIPGFPESIGEAGTDAYTWGYIKKKSEWKWADEY